MKDWDEDPNTGPLTADERKALRQLLLDESRARWLWSSIRIWAGWIGAVLVFLIAAQDYIIAFFRRLFGH